MTKQQRFENTTSVLIRSFLRGHLVHGNGCACAIGNMIADAREYSMRPLFGAPAWHSDGKPILPCWSTGGGGIKSNDPDVRELPYTHEELERIERSFEDVLLVDGWDYSPNSDPDGFRGLCAAIDTLMEIDEVETCCAEDVIALEGEFAEVATREPAHT